MVLARAPRVPHAWSLGAFAVTSPSAKCGALGTYSTTDLVWPRLLFLRDARAAPAASPQGAHGSPQKPAIQEAFVTTLCRERLLSIGTNKKHRSATYGSRVPAIKRSTHHAVPRARARALATRSIAPSAAEAETPTTYERLVNSRRRFYSNPTRSCAPPEARCRAAAGCANLGMPSSRLREAASGSSARQSRDRHSSPAAAASEI